MKQETLKGGVGSCSTPTHIYYIQTKIDFNIFMFRSLSNYIYRNIYFMCLERGYFYKGEIEQEILTKINSQVQNLLDKGIIEEIPIPRDYANYLYSCEGYNYHNVQKMRIYAFTRGIKEIMEDFREYLRFYSNSRIVEKFSKEKQHQENLEQYEKARYYRIKQKSLKLRSVEDNIFLDEYERKNGK